MLDAEQQSLCESLIPYVLTIARSYSPDDEYRSEALLALVECIEGFDASRGDVKAFVGSCVRNKLSRYRRRQDARKLRESVPRPLTSGEPHAYNAIVQLPDELREIAVDRWVEGCGWREMKRRHGLSLAKLQLLVRRAKDALERILDDTP